MNRHVTYLFRIYRALLVDYRSFLIDRLRYVLEGHATHSRLVQHARTCVRSLVFVSIHVDIHICVWALLYIFYQKSPISLQKSPILLLHGIVGCNSIVNTPVSSLVDIYVCVGALLWIYDRALFISRSVSFDRVWALLWIYRTLLIEKRSLLIADNCSHGCELSYGYVGLFWSKIGLLWWVSFDSRHLLTGVFTIQLRQRSRVATRQCSFAEISGSLGRECRSLLVTCLLRSHAVAPGGVHARTATVDPMQQEYRALVQGCRALLVENVGLCC